jgi:hypothetical protein
VVLLASRDHIVVKSTVQSPVMSAATERISSAAGDRTAFEFEELATFADGSLRSLLGLLLFGHFMLGFSLRRETVDWDDVLAPQVLAATVGLSAAPTGEVFRLTPIPLPDDWVDLILPHMTAT